MGGDSLDNVDEDFIGVVASTGSNPTAMGTTSIRCPESANQPMHIQCHRRQPGCTGALLELFPHPAGSDRLQIRNK
jgi:hypothetical protein